MRYASLHELTFGEEQRTHSCDYFAILFILPTSSALSTLYVPLSEFHCCCSIYPSVYLSKQVSTASQTCCLACHVVALRTAPGYLFRVAQGKSSTIYDIRLESLDNYFVRIEMLRCLETLNATLLL